MEINPSVATYWIVMPYSTAFTKDNQIAHGGHTYLVVELMDDATPLILKKARISRVSG
jgi:hypothetical protein